MRHLSKTLKKALTVSGKHLFSTYPSSKRGDGLLPEWLFESSPAAQFLLNPECRVVLWNRAAETLFGYLRNETKEKEIFKLVVPFADRPYTAVLCTKALSEGQSTSKHTSMTKSREEFYSEWQITRIEEGPFGGHLICVVSDITRTKNALDELNKRSIALESSGEAIIYTDPNGIIEFANRNFFSLFKAVNEEIYKLHLGEFLFGSVNGMNAIQPQFNPNHTWTGTVIKTCAGGERVFSVVITAIHNDRRLLSYIANLHDITELSSHVRSLTYQAHCDPLTGAANRSALNAALVGAIRRAQNAGTKAALFFIDLNDFKIVNDTHGHEAGDTLLAGIAANLRSCLRNSDTIARYGGDEFVVLIEEIKSQEHIETVLLTVQAAIDEPIRITGTLSITPKASIGIAVYPDDAATPDLLLQAADTSMYAAKKVKKQNLRNVIGPEPAPCAHSRSR